MVIFSSYGNDGKNGKDIYRVVRLPNGEWSKPAEIGEGINSKFDEDYPFLHPDGKTLYFSSKGYNSMGGYDIFKSQLNSETGKWSYPENLDFPINTPDDDILYISGIDNKLAFFASSRASKQGELTVYKVEVNGHPTQNSIVKGVFLAESNPSMKSATISILDAEKERTYGVYTTDSKNGEYLLVFPGNGGKYKILVETTDNAPIHSAIIELPVIEGFRALKQELRLVGEGDSEKLVVKNLFDEFAEFEMTDPLVVENLLKNKAQLNVNTTEAELLANNSTEEESDSQYADLSDEELKTQADKKADNIIEKAKASRNQADYSYQLANQKSIEAKKLFDESRSLESEAVNETDPVAKENKLKEAKKVKFQAANIVNETIAALNLAKALEGEAIERESDVSSVLSIKENIGSSIGSGDRDGAENNYADLDKIGEAAYHNQSVINTEKELAEDKLTEKEIAYNKARNEVNELANREIEINGEIESAETKLASTSKKNDKANLESQVSALKIDLEDVKYDLGVAKTNETKTKAAYTDLKNSSKSVTKIIEQVDKENKGAAIKPVDKLALSNNVAYFEKEGLVGLYPDPEESNTTEFENESEATTDNVEVFVLAEHKDEYTIIDDEGKLKDYNTEYSSNLVDAENEPDERQKSLHLAKVNQDWVMAIDEEIEIRKKESETTDNLNDKVRLKSKIQSLNALRDEKQKQADMQLLVAETLSGTSTQNEIAETNTSENTTEVNIIDDEGNLTDYNESYENEIAALDDGATNAEKVEIYENWSNAIEQEVLLKKVELNDASGDDKSVIETRINELETKLENNQELIAEYQNNNSVEETSTEVVSESEETTAAVDLSQYSNDVVASNGEVVDYSSNFKEELAASDNSEETSVNQKKEEITKNWINAIDEEIRYREEQISLTNDEDEVAVIQNRVNDLNALKNEKQEELVDYQLAINEENNAPTYATNPTENPTEYTSSEEDKALNVDYNADYNYNSTQSNRELGSVASLKEDAISLYAQSEEKINSLSAINDPSERENTLAEANQLKEQAQNKEVEIARVYAKTNRSEFYNNQAVLSKVKAGSNANSTNTTIAEMFVDESNTYLEQAIAERAKAENASSFTAKESLLQKAYHLELKALAKQSKAVELYANNESVNEVYAELNENTSTPTINETVAETNTSNETVNNTETSVSPSVEETSPVRTKSTPIYQPLAISLPSKEEKIKGDVLTKEAYDLELQAKVLTDSSETVKKKEKEVLIAQANELNQQAGVKRRKAEVHYFNATEMEGSEAELVDDLNENRTNLSNEELTKEDVALLQSLLAGEVESIANSDDFQNYAEAKKETRRLIKEAEVNYIEADKYQQEAEDEKTLGISLNALAAGAQGDAKTKLEGQLAKLDKMIADNEAKANEARSAATEKEKKAFRLTKEAEVILVSNNNDAAKFEAIEKANEYDSELLANVENTNNAKTAENNTNEEEAITEEVVEETATNEVEEVAETVTENNTNEEEAITEEVAEETTSNEVEEIAETVAENNTTENEETTSEEVVDDNASKVDALIAGILAEENNETEETATEEVAEEVTTNEVEEVAETVEENTNEVAETATEEVAEENTNEVEETTTEEVAEEFATNEVEEVESNEVEEIAETPTENTSVDKVPTVLTSPIFEFSGDNKASYSASNPIPGVEKLPEGLVFKVQIGAFRNPIPQDHFRGFAPIMVEDAGNGIKRYTAGFFKSINMAVEAKNSIRTIGYEDAFVVAFYNGKRISINEARAMANGEAIAENNTTTNNTAESVIETNTTENETTPVVNEAPALEENYEEVVDGVSTDVHKIEGTFFTIQVGVYSKPVTADQLSNVSPLNSEKTASGLIRYTSGVYKTLDEANVAKDRIRGLGITDAFVIAYTNGNRVTVSEALGYLNSSNNSSPSNNNGSENNNTTTPAVNNNTAGGTEGGTNTIENTTTTPPANNGASSSNTTEPTNTGGTEEGSNVAPVAKEPIDQVKVGQELNIEFKVLLGEYEDDIPVNDAAIYLKLSGQGMKMVEENGKFIYTIGSFPDYPSALDLQIEMKEEGISKPKVIAFKDGIKIEVEEALELVKNSN